MISGRRSFLGALGAALAATWPGTVRAADEGAPGGEAVVVGVDGSEASRAAIALAAREARYRGAPLIAVQAYSGERPLGAPAALGAGARSPAFSGFLSTDSLASLPLAGVMGRPSPPPVIGAAPAALEFVPRRRHAAPPCGFGQFARPPRREWAGRPALSEIPPR